MFPLPGRRGHPTIEDLSEHLDGRLGGDRRARMDSHLAGCDACRRSFEDLRATVLAVRSAPQPSPRRSHVFAAPPSAFASRGQDAAARGRSGGIGPAWALPVAAAAVFALFLGALGVDFSGMTAQTAPAPVAQTDAPQPDALGVPPTRAAEATPAAPNLTSAGDAEGAKMAVTITGDESAKRAVTVAGDQSASQDAQPPMAGVGLSATSTPRPSFAPAAAVAMPTGTPPPPTATEDGMVAYAPGPQATPSPEAASAFLQLATPSPAPAEDNPTGGARQPLGDWALTSASFDTTQKLEKVESITPSWLRAVEIALGGMSALLAAAALYTWRRG